MINLFVSHYDIEHLSDLDVENYLSSLDFKSDFIKLEGPFFSEEYAIKHYNSCCEKVKTHRSNLIIARKLVVLANNEFKTRDNERVCCGIDPYSHTFEMFVNSKTLDLCVNTIDGLYLENKNDIEKATELIKKYPPTDKELRAIF